MRALLLTFAAALGLTLGSFANVLIIRLRRGDSPLRGRSRCPHCGRVLAWYDLVPVVSYLSLRGKCRTCRAPISPQYPLVELAVSALVVFAAWRFGLSAAAALSAVLFTLLAVIFVYDFRHRQILDQVSLPAVAVGLGLSLVLQRTWLSIGLGVLVGGGFFLLQYFISRGRWIGGGDIRLGAAVGAATGWPLVLVALVLAYFLGAAVALVLLALRRTRWTAELPFGTFLTLAGVMTVLVGSQLLDWYLHDGFFRWFYVHFLI